MKIDELNPKHIIADEGKVFKRIADGTVYGSEIFLGKSWYINGEKLETPHDDVAEDFEEVDAPKEETIESSEESPRQRVKFVRPTKE